MSKIIVLGEESLDAKLQALREELKREIQLSKAEYGKDKLLTTKELATLFPRGEKWFRESIAAGKFGRVDRNNYCSATYEEAFNYLFNKP